MLSLTPGREAGLTSGSVLLTPVDPKTREALHNFCSTYAADPIGYRHCGVILSAAAVDDAMRPFASAPSVAFSISIST